MNNFIKKLLFSIFSLTFFFSILGTVTYAWFSLSKINQLGNLSVRLVTGDEFQISLDGINYGKKITTEEIERAIGFKAKLSDVTSLDGENFQFGELRQDSLPQENLDYLSFPLYFRSTRPQRFIYLVENVSNLVEYDQGRDGTYVVSRGINWRADCTFINGPNPDTDTVYPGNKGVYHASKAIRISFIEKKYEGNTNDQRGEEELVRKIFDLSEEPERGYGTAFGELSYFNAKHNSNREPPTFKPNTIYQLTSFEYQNSNVALGNNSQILELIETTEVDEEGNIYYFGKVLVFVWIEGWDADCFNAIYRDSLRIQLKFRLGNPKLDVV